MAFIKLPSEGFHHAGCSAPLYITIVLYLYRNSQGDKDTRYGTVSIQEIKDLFGYGRNSKQTERIRSTLKNLLNSDFLSLDSRFIKQNVKCDIGTAAPLKTLYYKFDKTVFNNLPDGTWTKFEEKTIDTLLNSERNFNMPNNRLYNLVNIYFFVHRRIYNECYKVTINSLKKDLRLTGDTIYDCLQVIECMELLYHKQFYNPLTKQKETYFRRDPFTDSFVPDEIKEAHGKFQRSLQRGGFGF